MYGCYARVSLAAGYIASPFFSGLGHFMNNLDIFQINICNSLWSEDDDSSNEAQRIFLEYCERDAPDYYNAERIARTWLRCKGLLGLCNNLYPDPPHEDIGNFFEARLPNLWRAV